MSACPCGLVRNVSAEAGGSMGVEAINRNALIQVLLELQLDIL
jgi:hypothetical protein